MSEEKKVTITIDQIRAELKYVAGMLIEGDERRAKDAALSLYEKVLDTIGNGAIGQTEQARFAREASKAAAIIRNWPVGR